MENAPAKYCNESALNKPYYTPATLTEQERAASALRYLDPACSYEDWVRIAMAAKAAGLSFDDFHSWSALAANYAGENDCRNVWKSIDASGGVTAATLFKAALDQGWQDPAKGTNRNAIVPVVKVVDAGMQPASPVENPKAAQVWSLCEPAPAGHPYIAKKGGLPNGLRIYPATAPTLIIHDKSGAYDVSGWLVVPCWADGKLQTLQFISGEGKKLNLPGATFGDGFFTVGTISAGGCIYIGEGIGQAWANHAATDAAAVVTSGAGRMKVVAAALRARYPAARLILMPDRGKERQVQAIAAAVNGAWCELPSDKPANYDANDYAWEFGGDALADLLNRAKTPPMRFTLLTANDLSKAPPMCWIVRGVLPQEGLAALFGPSGSGKSFLVLDIAATVAGGDDDWFGRRVTPCPVTYCALEGEAGMGKRVTAWSQHHNKPVPDGLRFITQPFDLLGGRDVVELASAIQGAGGVGGLVILDTLNRAAPGADENSSVDMGNIIAAAKRLQSLTGGLVLLVHHTGKDASKGLRGHSSLYAALDGAIEVSRTDSRRAWSVAKSKDDETGSVHPFRLEVVPVGIDDEGEEITSCVAVVDDAVDTINRVKLPQGGHQKIALDTLAKPLRESKEFNKDGAPPGHPCLRLDDAIRLVTERMTCEAKRRTERARKALSDLVAKGIYGLKGDWLWRV